MGKSREVDWEGQKKRGQAGNQAEVLSQQTLGMALPPCTSSALGSPALLPWPRPQPHPWGPGAQQ